MTVPIEKVTNSVYYHYEIAFLYFPDSSNKKSAARKLSNWIKRDFTLHNQLVAVGYFSRQKIFTPKQLQVLYEFLGEP